MTAQNAAPSMTPEAAQSHPNSHLSLTVAAVSGLVALLCLVLLAVAGDTVALGVLVALGVVLALVLLALLAAVAAIALVFGGGHHE